MAKSSPEKLAQALRANLLRRKQGAPSKAPKPAAQPGAKAGEKPPNNSA